MNNHPHGGSTGSAFGRPLFCALFCSLLFVAALPAQRGSEFSLSDFKSIGIGFETYVTAKAKTVYHQQPEMFWTRRPIGFELKAHYNTFFRPRWGIEVAGYVGAIPLESNVLIPQEFIGVLPDDYSELALGRMPYWGLSATFLHLKRFKNNGYLVVGLGLSLNKLPVSMASYGGGYWDSMMVDRPIFRLEYDIPRSRTVQPTGLMMFKYYRHIGKLCYLFASIEGSYAPFKMAIGDFTAWGINDQIVTGSIDKRLTNVGFEVGIQWALVKRKEMFGKKKPPVEGE